MQYKCCNITQYILNLHLDRLTEIRKTTSLVCWLWWGRRRNKKERNQGRKFCCKYFESSFRVIYTIPRSRKYLYICLLYTLDDAYNIQSMQQIMEIVLWKYVEAAIRRRIIASYQNILFACNNNFSKLKVLKCCPLC